MRTATSTLTAFKIAVGSGGATLTGFELVRVHAKAHRAACFSPVKASILEDAVKALLLSLLADKPRAGHDHSVDVRSDLATLDHESSSTQVFNASVCA